MKTRRLASAVLVLALSVGGLQAAEAPKAPPLDLKGTRILVSAGYWGGMAGMPALKKLTDAGRRSGFVRGRT